MDSCDAVGKATLQRLAHTPGVVHEIPVPSWLGARDCQFKADDVSRFLDVIVWDSVDRSWSEVVHQSHLPAAHVTRVKVAGAHRAVLITSTSRPSATQLVALRDGVIFLSSVTSSLADGDMPIVRALMKRILAHTS
jgi:hypothetical protein